jgi:hypothetical protein
MALFDTVQKPKDADIVRRELGLREARVRASDPHLWFAS